MMEERGDANAAMDRISELPQFIIHQILSYLSTKEAAQTSVLSKTWLQAWSTTPILILKDYIFSNSPRNNQHQFFSFINNTLLRYRTHNLRIHKFEIDLLRVDDDHDASVYRLLDESIGTALDHGVKELLIYTGNTLPQTIFSTSAKALTKLKLCYCDFPQNFASNTTMNFPYLKKLTIHYSDMDDGMLQKLLSSCPSVEKINFHWVSGFKKFLVSNLDQLKKLSIATSHCETIEVDIEDAPSLLILKCSNFDVYGMPIYLKVGSAQNLKHLVLDAMTNITTNVLNELITRFPLLEILEISFCHSLERINVSSRSLKHLFLSDCRELVEANIDAPNLLTLKYNNNYRIDLSLSLVNIPEELMTYTYLDKFEIGSPEFTWFHHLRKLLKSVSRATVSFCIWQNSVDFSTHLHLIANKLPLENYTPKINHSSSAFAAFIETLFSSSRPIVISTQKGNYQNYNDCIEFLGNELIMATRNSNCCNSDEETKCWRHYLNDVKVEVYKNSQDAWQRPHSYENSHEAWQPHSWETLLVKSTLLDKPIRFSLKWNADFNA